MKTFKPASISSALAWKANGEQPEAAEAFQEGRKYPRLMRPSRQLLRFAETLADFSGRFCYDGVAGIVHQRHLAFGPIIMKFLDDAFQTIEPLRFDNER